MYTITWKSKAEIIGFQATKQTEREMLLLVASLESDAEIYDVEVIENGQN